MQWRNQYATVGGRLPACHRDSSRGRPPVTAAAQAGRGGCLPQPGRPCMPAILISGFRSGIGRERKLNGTGSEVARGRPRTIEIVLSSSSGVEVELESELLCRPHRVPLA